jgi:hypothetical protein
MTVEPFNPLALGRRRAHRGKGCVFPPGQFLRCAPPR